MGSYIETATAGEQVRAYATPPPVPALVLDPLFILMERASQALSRLVNVTTILPDTELFLYMYVCKEALLSSQIEGTQSSLSDLLQFESNATPGVPLAEIGTVSFFPKEK